MDGTVIDRDVEEGEIVIAGTTNLPGTVLMTIGDMDRMRVRADVDETRRGSDPAGPTRPDLPAGGSGRSGARRSVDLIAPKGTKSCEVVSFETLINVSANTIRCCRR